VVPLRGVPCVSHISELAEVDAALVCVPPDAAGGVVHELLQGGVPVVECAAIDGDALRAHQARIAHDAERFRAGAVVGAGWQCGVLPQLQRLFELLVPAGRTRVGRHVAAGLHHTAAAEGVAGVQDALCTEVHDAAGALQRYVYVQLAPGADFERVRRQIEADPLFADAPAQVLEAPDLTALQNLQLGVLIERLGEGGAGPHASLLLEARIEPVACSARLMLDAARLLPRHARQGWRYTPFGLVPLDGRNAAA
jgi:diaminopimelate dehydrogenase